MPFSSFTRRANHCGTARPFPTPGRSRLGDAAVTLLATQPGHRPEYAASDVSPAKASCPPASGVRPAAGHPRKARATHTSTSVQAQAEAPRPLWLLEEARPLGVALEEKPWILRDGPERIESGWWDGHDFRRDYFVAEDPGGSIVWLYRDHRYGTDDGEWFMHGWFA
jgi:protein ImuB